MDSRTSIGNVFLKKTNHALPKHDIRNPRMQRLIPAHKNQLALFDAFQNFVMRFFIQKACDYDIKNLKLPILFLMSFKHLLK